MDAKESWFRRRSPALCRSYEGYVFGSKILEREYPKNLTTRGRPYRHIGVAAIPEVIADLLADGKVIGLLQGRMEFGPRALGARSIIGDPRSAKMQSMMNLKIKYRESFRPFAPSVLRDELS